MVKHGQVQWMWFVLVGAVLSLSAGGCININANASADGWSKKLDEKIDKSAAISTARDKAAAEGLNADKKKYKATATSSKEEEGAWWVQFDAIDPDITRPAKFSVYVDAKGKATLYK